MVVNTNTIKCIKNNDFVPIPNASVHNSDTSRYVNGHNIKGVWNYFSTDNYETHQKNLEKKPKDWYYRNHKVNYTLNSYGYRTNEFEDIDWKNSIVLFGCSHMFGEGVDDNDTISANLERLIRVPVINMGMSGTSIQFALHNSLMLYKKYGPPKAVLYGLTGLTRYMFYHKYYVSNSTRYEGTPEEEKYICDHFIPYNLINLELIKRLWEDKCKCHIFSTFERTSEILKCKRYAYIKNDYGRDCEHFGIRSTKHIASCIHADLLKRDS